jgi:hypothetical protein
MLRLVRSSAIPEAAESRGLPGLNFSGLSTIVSCQNGGKVRKSRRRGGKLIFVSLSAASILPHPMKSPRFASRAAQTHVRLE